MIFLESRDGPVDGIKNEETTSTLKDPSNRKDPEDQSVLLFYFSLHSLLACTRQIPCLHAPPFSGIFKNGILNHVILKNGIWNLKSGIWNLKTEFEI